MSFLEKIKSSLFYDGLTKEEYNSIVPFIMKENNRRLKVYNIVDLIFVGILFFISLIFSGFSTKTFVYLGGALANFLVILILYSKFQNNFICSKFLNYFFTSLMLSFAIYVETVKTSGLPASMFYAAFVLIPYLTYDKVLYSFIHRLIFLVVFIVLSYKTKRYEYFQTDMIYGISVFLLSTFAGVRVQKIQVNGWLMTNNMGKELKKMSSIFENIRVIDLNANTSIDYSTDSYDENRIIGSNNDANKQIEEYIEEFVSENNKLHMQQFCDLSTLEDRMFNEKILICDYATKDITWRRASFVAIEEDSKGFTTKVVFTIQRIADAFYLNMLDFDLKKIN